MQEKSEKSPRRTIFLFLCCFSHSNNGVLQLTDNKVEREACCVSHSNNGVLQRPLAVKVISLLFLLSRRRESTAKFFINHNLTCCFYHPDDGNQQLYGFVEEGVMSCFSHSNNGNQQHLKNNYKYEKNCTVSTIQTTGINSWTYLPQSFQRLFLPSRRRESTAPTKSIN